MLYLCGLIVSSTVSGCVLFAIMDALYEKKYLNNSLYYWVAFFLYIILSAIVAMNEWPGVNAVYSMVVLCLISYILYKTSKKNVLINSVIVIIYFALVDLIVTTALSIFSDVNLYVALRNSQFFLFSGVCNALVMLCTCNLLIQLIKHTRIEKVSKHIHTYTIFLMVFELGILCYFMENDKNASNNIALLMLAMGFVVIDGGVLYLFRMLSQNAMLEKQTELAEQQCKMTTKYYESLQNQYDDIQKLIHDFKKHIQVIENLDTKQNEVRKNYINELKDSINNISQQYKCEDEILCTIVWEKIQVCKQENITLELNLQHTKFDFMEKREVTSLFANLLDNAIEACRECQKEKKEICLRVHKFNQYIVIGMRNTIGSALHYKNGNLQSSKPGHLGMGIAILSNLANKYCGNINFEYSQEYFETKIILSTSNTLIL